MNCKTRMEKLTEAWENVKRFFLITLISVVGTAIFAIFLAFGLTARENRELKEQIKVYEEQNNVKEEKATKHSSTKYIVVVDDVTGEVIYTDYQ